MQQNSKRLLFTLRMNIPILFMVTKNSDPYTYF
jgi:hypothetical protein